jgi:hypothetical protein
MKAKSLVVVSTLVLLAAVLSACNMPGRGEATEEPEPTLTPTLRPAGGEEAGEAPEETEEPAETEAPEETEEVAEGPCYDVEFVDDVSIPDGTEIVAGEGFDKTWRLRSSGCLPLPAGSQLIFDSGDSMGGPASVAVPSVAVGAEFDVTVHLTAPNTPGEYTGYWHIVGPTGDYVGQVYVQIEVVAPPPEETEEPTEEPTDEPDGEVGPALALVNLTPVASMSGHWSSGGCADEIEAGVFSNGDWYRGFATFNIDGMQGATILEATLDLSDYQATSHAFADLGPLLIEQIIYDHQCGGTALTRAPVTLLESAGHPPDIQSEIDVTDALDDWVNSDSPDTFQIRFRWEGDNYDLTNRIRFYSMQLTVEYEH